MKTDLAVEAAKWQENLIQIRRHLHSFPELGSEMDHTVEFVKKHLESLGVETDYSPDTGLVGVIRGAGKGPCVLLRADMDGLPIQEENDIPYRSVREGRMHACGHDAHMTWLLGATALLMAHRDEIQGIVKLAFQPCEEGKGRPGAEDMIRGGIMERPRVDVAVAVHADPSVLAGRYSISPGGVTTTPCLFEIAVKGRGGHAAEPWDCVDPILVMNQIYQAVQSIQRSELSPQHKSVISITSMRAGEASNVIPERGIMAGTIRTFSREDARVLAERIKQISLAVGSAHGAEVKYEYEIPIGSSVNDVEICSQVERAVRELYGDEAVEREEHLFMGGDDFSFFAERVPSCYFFAGVRNESLSCVNPLHSCRFDLDESCLSRTAAVLAQFTLNYMEQMGEQ